MMVEPQPLTADEKDILVELGNIGGGHAATALSRLVGIPVLISVPEVTLIPAADLPRRYRFSHPRAAAVEATFRGGLGGAVGVLFEEKCFQRLSETLSGSIQPGRSEDLERSAALEMGNIMLGAFVSALADLLNLPLDLNSPRVHINTVPALIRSILSRLRVRKEFLFAITLRVQNSMEIELLALLNESQTRELLARSRRLL